MRLPTLVFCCAFIAAGCGGRSGGQLPVNLSAPVPQSVSSSSITTDDILAIDDRSIPAAPDVSTLNSGAVGVASLENHAVGSALQATGFARERRAASVGSGAAEGAIDRRGPLSSAGPNDHEDAGIVTNGGGPYTAVFAMHTVYVSGVQVPPPTGVTGEQTLYAPTTMSPDGGCIEDGTAYLNSDGVESPPQFYAFDWCASSPYFALVTTIDRTFAKKYIRKTALRPPFYLLWIATPKSQPGASASWSAMLFNFASSRWDVVYQSSGFGGGFGSWSIFEFYFLPGQCPSNLAPFSVDALAYYNAASARWDLVRPVMDGQTTSVATGPPGSCFVADSTGGASYVFSLLRPDWSWLVRSTGQ